MNKVNQNLDLKDIFEPNYQGFTFDKAMLMLGYKPQIYKEEIPFFDGKKSKKNIQFIKNKYFDKSNTNKKEIIQEEQEEDNRDSSKEITMQNIEKLIEKKLNEKNYLDEIDNLIGHIKFLYGVLNNVMFCLNQHGVVINKKIISKQENYVESKLILRLLDNLDQAVCSDNYLRSLNDKDSLSVIENKSSKDSNTNITSNANHIIQPSSTEVKNKMKQNKGKFDQKIKI